jgi:hypothetical protein
MQVQQLIYQSSLAVAVTPIHLRQLLPAWQTRNRNAAISGLLLYGEEGVMQVLEGPAEQVHKTYARITRDRRHYNVCTLADGVVPSRAFARWSMSFVQLDAPDLGRLAKHVSFEELTQPEQWPELMALLQEFVTREQYPFSG